MQQTYQVLCWNLGTKYENNDFFFREVDLAPKATELFLFLLVLLLSYAFVQGFLHILLFLRRKTVAFERRNSEY